MPGTSTFSQQFFPVACADGLQQPLGPMSDVQVLRGAWTWQDRAVVAHEEVSIEREREIEKDKMTFDQKSIMKAGGERKMDRTARSFFTSATSTSNPLCPGSCRRMTDMGCFRQKTILIPHTDGILTS